MKLIKKISMPIFVITISLACSLCACDNKKNTVVIDETEGEISSELSEEKNTIYVQISGAIRNPGVYKIEDCIRVFELIDMAGGALENANTDVINLARPVYDEMTIYIPTNDEVLEGAYSEQQYLVESEDNNGTGGKVNINNASKDVLMTLPGIGESKAEAIISYRENSGRFSAIEDIMNVSGIKQSAFDKIKEFIIV